MRILLPLLMTASFLLPQAAAAAELAGDETTFARAIVVEVRSEAMERIPGTEATQTVQQLRARIISGEEEGSIVDLVNDYAPLGAGDTFYLRRTASSLDGTVAYSVADPYRLPVLYALLALFLLCLFFFGGIQGVRGLVALVGSFALIGYALLPGILAGYSPLLVALCVSAVIVVLGSYVTHGFTRTTTAAVLGMLATISITGLLAYASVTLGNFTGYAAEESVYLRFSEGVPIDLVGLLLAGIMIGLLGVLYDIAIGQAVAVEELMRHGKLSARDAYRRGLRIGREHIGALVNTLAIAYAGAALPLLLLFTMSDVGYAYIVNGEVFAAEAVRTLVGSIGLILAVPITTAIAAYMLRAVGETDRQVEGGHAEHRHR
jgi:uncharacterized membrane protein